MAHTQIFESTLTTFAMDYSKYAAFSTIGSAISNLAQNLVCNKAIKSEQKMKRTGKMKQKMKKAGKTKQKLK